MAVTRTSMRWRCSDQLWAFVSPRLPVHKNTHRFGGGRPRVNDRAAFDALLFVLRTGCQWNALNATGICSSSSAHRRFQEWVQAGVLKKLWIDGLSCYDELKGIDWKWQSMDGAMTKAPLGGEKMRAKPDGSGQIRREAKPADRRPRRADRTGGGRRERE